MRKSLIGAAVALGIASFLSGGAALAKPPATADMDRDLYKPVGRPLRKKVVRQDNRDDRKDMKDNRMDRRDDRKDKRNDDQR